MNAATRGSIRDYALADSTLSSLLGVRVLWDYAPPGTQHPYVLLSLLSATPVSSHDGPSDLHYGLLQAAIYASLHSSADAVLSAIVARLGNALVTTGGVNWQTVYIATPSYMEPPAAGDKPALLRIAEFRVSFTF